MNQGEMDYQSAADQSHAGLAILLLLGRAMPWLVFFAVATLGSTLPEQLNPTPARLGWLAASYFLPAALLSAQAVNLVQKRGTRQGLILMFLLTAAALLVASALPGLGGACVGMALGGVALSLAQPATRLAAMAHTDATARPLVMFMAQAGLPMAAILAGVVLPPQAGYRGWQAALPTWVPVALFLALLVRVWIPPDDRPDSVLPRLGPTQVNQQPPWLLAAIDAMVGLVFSCCALWLGMYAHLLAMPTNGITPLMVSLGGAGLVALGLASWLEDRVARPAWVPGLLLLCAAATVALLPMASQAQRWPLWLAAAGIGFTLFACHELLVRLLAPEWPSTPELSVGIGEMGVNSVYPTSTFSTTQAQPPTGIQPEATFAETRAFPPGEDPGPFPSTLGGATRDDPATAPAAVTTGTSTFAPTSTFATTSTFAASSTVTPTSAFPTSTMRLSPDTAQPEVQATQTAGPPSRLFPPTTGGTRVKHNPPGYVRTTGPAPGVLQDPPDTTQAADAPSPGPTIDAAATPDVTPGEGPREPGFQTEGAETPLPEGTVPPTLLARNTHRLTTVTPNPAITQLITAHFLGAAAGPLVLGFMTGSLAGFDFLWYLLAAPLALAGMLCLLLPKPHRSV